MKKICACWFLILLVLFESLQAQESLVPVKDSVWQIVHSDTSDQKKLDVIFDAVFYYDFAPFTFALIQYADSLSEVTQNERGKIESLLSMGQYYNFSSKYDSAALFFERGLSLPNINEHIAFKAEFLEGKAVAASRSDRIQEAINYFMLSLEILENPISRKAYIESEGEEDLKKMASIIHNNSGNLYKRVEEYDEAVLQYEKAIKLMYELDAERYAATVIMNKANALLEQEKYKEALETHRIAKGLKVKFDATDRTIAFSDLNIGICLSGLDSLKEGLVSIGKAVVVFEELNNIKGLTYGYAERGLIYSKMNLIDKAVEDCERSKAIMSKEGVVDYANKVYSCLYQSHKRSGNYKQALFNHEDLMSIQDSALNADNFRKIGQLESKFENDKSMAVQELKFQQQQRTNKMNVIGLGSLVAGLLVISGLIYRNYRFKSRSEKLLADKNKIISKALGEKEILLREIHHRVKNNLQFISSLLALQTEHVEDDIALGALQEGQDRVQSMALIHQNLYQDDNLTGVDMSLYFKKLVRGLFDSYNVRKDQIKLRLEIEPLQLDVDSVVPIGLVTNELISNCLKYAFPEKREGEILVKLNEVNDELILEVIDDGVGMTQDIEESESFGFRLVKVFKDQLRASLEIDGTSGTKIKMSIKNYEKV